MLTAEEMVERIQSEEFILDYKHMEAHQAVMKADPRDTRELLRLMDTMSRYRERLDAVRHLMADMLIDPLSDEEKMRRYDAMRPVPGTSEGGVDGKQDDGE